jgi:hypothetical protein
VLSWMESRGSCRSSSFDGQGIASAPKEFPPCGPCFPAEHAAQEREYGLAGKRKPLG